MRKYLTILFFLFYVIANATDTNYYFSQSGDDDTGDGSITTPWKTITKFNTLTFAADDSIFFNRGDTWSGSAMRPKGDGTSGHNVVITAYGTGAKPIITARDTLIGWSGAGNWTEIISNVWKISQARVGTASCKRLWIDGVEKERPGVPQQTNTFPPTALKPWYQHTDSAFVYVYSVTNPAIAFSSIQKAVSLLDATYSSLIHFDTDNYFTVSYLNFQDGYVGIDIDDSQGIVIDSCEISSWYGIRTDGTAADADHWAQDIEIKNCDFDPHRLQVYDGWEADYTQDAVNIGGSSRRINIHDNYFRDYGHNAYSLESLGTERVDTIKFYDNELTSPNVDYGNRLSAYYRFGSGNEIYRNYVHNGSIQNQFNGRNLMFYYNVIDTIKEPAWSDNNGTGIYIGENANDAYPDSMKFYNNVLANCGSSAIRMAWWSVAYQQVYDNQFVNNIIYNPADYGIYLEDQDSVFRNVFKNNIIYKSSGGNAIYYRGTAMSVATFNTSDAENDIISDNIGDNPMFDSGFELNAASPAINAGIDVSLTSDYLEKPVPYEALPDIGAYEFYDTPSPGTTTFGKTLNGLKYLKDLNGNFIKIIK